MKKIAVMTSGGDAPGMNAAVRGVVRTALDENLNIIGFNRGYAGLLNKEYHHLDVSSVGGILEEGGTILRTFRCPEFKKREAQLQVADNLDSLGIEGLVVIGGEGSLRGAMALDKVWSGGIVGIPASIDNDVAGTDMCLGFDTAVNTALESVDRIRDTATSHERLFIIEVMGRDSGHIALSVGLAGGAEEVLVPENDYSVEEIGDRIEEGRRKGKLHYIIVLAEGAGKGFKIADQLEKLSGMEIRVAVLGHIQRGGSPTAWDRIIGGKMGYFAVQTLVEGISGVCVGIRSGDKNLVALAEAVGKKELSKINEKIAATFAK